MLLCKKLHNKRNDLEVFFLIIVISFVRKVKYPRINPGRTDCTIFLYFALPVRSKIRNITKLINENSDHGYCIYFIFFRFIVISSFSLLTVMDSAVAVATENRIQGTYFRASLFHFRLNRSWRTLRGEFHFYSKHLNLMKCFSPGVWLWDWHQSWWIGVIRITLVTTSLSLSI